MREDALERGLLGVLTASMPRLVFASLVLGTLAGFAYVLIVPLILLAIHVEDDPFVVAEVARPIVIAGFEVTRPTQAAAFFGLLLLLLVARTTSQIMFNRAIVLTTSRLRVHLCQRIARLPIQKLERIGQPVLLTALNVDVPRIATGASTLPGILFNVTSLLGMLGYLAIVDLNVLLWVSGAILFCVLTYRLAVYVSDRYLRRARSVADRISAGVDGLVRGAKELKLNRARRIAFMQEKIHDEERAITRLNLVGNAILMTASNYGTLASFFAIGVLVYAVANFYLLPNSHVIGVVMVMLYATGPIATITGFIAPYLQGRVSLRRLRTLVQEMVEEPVGTGEVPPFSEMRLRAVVHRYDAELSPDHSFAVGPIDLTLREGQLTYLTGGNGSGKSTLAKIISCHYRPERGDIFMGRTPVSDANIESARQFIAATYTDFFLFTRLFGITAERLKHAERYLERLGLAGKVSIEHASFSTLALSDGQRKRLALLVAVMEDRKVYVFDEWAADQDPGFKELFYCELLPELRRQQKIVVVVTHDDRYFQLADQLVKMEEGRIVSVVRPDSTRAERASQAQVH